MSNPANGRPMPVGRRDTALRKVGLPLVGILLGFALAWLILPRFITPQQAEEARSVPAPEPVTAPVEEGVIREVIQVEGVVEPVESLHIKAPQPDDADRPVVTYVPPVGSTVATGGLLLGMSDRPVVYLGEHQNLYRPLHRGMTGADVAAFQEFLVDTGNLEPDDFERGVFGAETEGAVEALYLALGYEPAAPTVEYTAEALAAARRNISQAAGALRAARQSGDQQAIAEAERTLGIERLKFEALATNPRLSVPVEEAVGLAHDTVVVVGSPFREGAVVEVGTPILEVRTEVMVLRATMSRLRGSGVTPGYAAFVTAPSGQVEAVVEHVAPRADDPGLVEITMPWNRPAVPGERYLVEIETARTETSVLSVPAPAVRSAGDGTAYVTVLEAGNSRRVIVDLGVTLGGRTEVVGNLLPGQQVIVGQR